VIIKGSKVFLIMVFKELFSESEMMRGMTVILNLD